MLCYCPYKFSWHFNDGFVVDHVRFLCVDHYLFFISLGSYFTQKPVDLSCYVKIFTCFFGLSSYVTKNAICLCYVPEYQTYTWHIYVDIHERCLLLLSTLKKKKNMVGRFSSKFSKYDFPKIRRLGAELLHTDGQTDRLLERQRDVTNSVAAFHKFAGSFYKSVPSSYKTKYISISKPKRRGYNCSLRMCGFEIMQNF